MRKNLERHILKIGNVLKLWRMGNLTIEGKITIFKTFPMSKIVHLVLVTNVLTEIISELKKIQKKLLEVAAIPKLNIYSL